MRCGTSFLYQTLNQHPCISPAIKKEIRFFCDRNGNFRRGLAWYRAHFPLGPLKQVDEPTRRLRITGEATPYYFWHPRVPKRIAETLPDARFILLLRNPADRAYSHYNKATRKGWEPLSFEEAVDVLYDVPFEEADRIAVEGLELTLEQWLQRRPLNYPRTNHAPCNAYLCWGAYVNYLANWYRYVSEEKIMVVRSEDLYREPARTIARVFDFVGVPSKKLKSYTLLYQPQNYPSMNPSTRTRLIEYYKPHNRRLYELLGKDMMWDK